jgi:hypothetical protein
LTVIAILLALSVEGMSFDIYTGSGAVKKEGADSRPDGVERSNKT